MNILFTRFGVIVGIIFLLPWLALLGFGGYWLWLQGWLYYGIGILSANFMLVYALVYWQSRSRKPLVVQQIEISPEGNWSDAGDKANQALEPLIEKWQQQDNVLTDTKKLLLMTNDVLLTVAKHFHADSRYPLLEFPLPYLLKLVALVCKDLQCEVLDKIPGSHALTLSNLLQAKQALTMLSKAQTVFKIGQWLVNWPGAALAKARSVLLDRGIETVSQELSKRLISVYIQKLGYYAIELYSGRITLDDIDPTSQISPDSRRDNEQQHQAAKQLSTEPLRILVLGQVSSGKSSLINALFNDLKTAVDLLPTTAKITRFTLEREGLPQAIILDSAGYGGLTHTQTSAELKKALNQIDIVLMVCKATNAARDADVLQLKAIREHFLQQNNKKLPVIIAVATHIDQLRPSNEWQPPYDLEQKDKLKAQNIKAACEAIADDFQKAVADEDLKSVVPVCLAPSRIYNVEEGLMPALHEHLNDAQRGRFLRCLGLHQRREFGQQWVKQIVNLVRN